MVHYLDKELK